MYRLTKIIAAVMATTLLLGACGLSIGGEDEPNAAERRAVDQPTEDMPYSPTAETINEWIRTWRVEGKLSFAYIQDMNGDYGYYVLEGLPVSYGASIDENYEVHTNGTDGIAISPAPAQDGVFYSGGFQSYYGFDATTGMYMEWSVGMGQNYFVYEEPMNHLAHLQDATPQGNTTIEDVEDELEEEE